jgi:Tol biopolymer transport system component
MKSDLFGGCVPLLLAGVLATSVASAAVPYVPPPAREPVLRQIDLPHSYYWREMYLPQLTSGPSSFDFSPDGRSLIYSMAGSLWQQSIGDEVAVELTHGPGYDYQPDWSPDGRYVVFVRHERNALELWQLDLTTRQVRQLTSTRAVNVQPRYSPDGLRLAYVSTAGTGHFNLYLASIDGARLGTPRALVPPRESAIARYYYSTHDHAIDPSWTPDGKRIVFVSNREVAYGTGNLCSVNVDDAADHNCFWHEETSWRANPQVAPDGRRVLYSSYQGRQWHQLWLTTLSGEASLPLTFGDFDITQARWSPDGRRIGYISNEDGNVSLWLQEVVGGERRRIEPRRREYRRPMFSLQVKLTEPQGQPVAGRVSVVAGDRRVYGPDGAWLHADDGYDPTRQREETHYFHCVGQCSVTVPEGDIQVTAWRGQAYTPLQRKVRVARARPNAVTFALEPLKLPEWAPRSVSADLHVHMNYGGHYRHTLATLADQARAEDLDVIYNTIVNKEQRIPDIAQFGPGPFARDGVTIIQAQEYHTSYWGHLGLLHLQERFLTPDFSAYQRSAFTSPYPHNGVIADLAHRQGALVGYVHPYDNPIVPEKEKTLTHTLPADVALGKTDYLEVVGFSDHRSTAGVWYKLLNLGFRIPAGAGTDAMANYASLRGPVGMNRVYLHTGGSTEPGALRDALKAGRTFVSNGPQLALQIESSNPGDTLTVPEGKERVRYRGALRSPVPIDHLELLYNGRVVATHRLGKERVDVDIIGDLTVRESGWILLRAWNEGAHPLIFDLYPYATTSPVYLQVAGSELRSPQDATYFVRWMDRVISAAETRNDYNDVAEKQETLEYLRAARAVYAGKAQ